MLSSAVTLAFATADAVNMALAVIGVVTASALLWNPKGLTAPDSRTVTIATGTIATGTIAAGTIAQGTPADGTSAGSTAGGRRISVIVPARNEEHSLPRLLGSLAHSDTPFHELIVVDDGSTDATARVAAAYGATVISPGELPPGWAGKPWACECGAEQAAGELLVFLDADTWLAPDALQLLDSAQRASGGLLSVQPRHHPGAPVEELSLLFNLVAVMGSGEFAASTVPGRARVAFGPCLVCTAEDYRRAGGHAAAPGAVVEDIELARSFTAVDLPVSCRLGADQVGYRMYPEGFGAIVRGWSKNIAAGAAASRPVALVASVLWISALAAAAVRLASGLAGWAGGSTSGWVGGGVPWWSAAVYMVLAAHLGWLAARVGRFRWTTVLVYPVPLAFFVGVFARSALLTATRRPVRWSGRNVPTGSARR